MSMVYGFLKRRIKYAGDDKDSNEGEKKMDEVWINYSGMSVCFGLKKFAIMTDLRCDRPEEPLIKETPHKGSNKRKVKKDGLYDIVGPSYKEEDLMVNPENKNIPKHYKKKLCLVWFVHSVLLARDIRKVIEHDLLVLAYDFGKFNDYPWRYDSYYLTVEYLLTTLSPKTLTLYGFPWAFMAWACEGSLGGWQQQRTTKNILRRLISLTLWMMQCVVHPWIVPTVDELGMTSFFTLGLVDIKEDPTMELIKKELAGATSIRRAVRQGQPNVEALHDQPQTTTDPGASSGGVAGGVIYDDGNHPDASVAASRDYEHVVCKDKEDKLLEKLKAIAEAVEELKSRRSVIPSNEK
ncbi:hypothetical protein P3S68_001342 [Capsicum galapagoense]